MSKSITLNEREMITMHSTFGSLEATSRDQLHLYLKLHKELGYEKIDKNDIVDMFAEIQNYIRAEGRLVQSESDLFEAHFLQNKDFNLKSVLADSGVGTYLRSSDKTFKWNKSTQGIEYTNCSLDDLIELHKQVKKAKLY